MQAAKTTQLDNPALLRVFVFSLVIDTLSLGRSGCLLDGTVGFEDLVQNMSALINDTVLQPLSRFFLDFDRSDWIVLCSLLAGAIAVGFILGRFPISRDSRVYRATSFQNYGEQLVSQITQKYFGPPDYHLMNHVTLVLEDGSTQIDHILVSRYGVFVIETKDYEGWIFANPSQPIWTQVLFHVTFKFQNPINQNLRHMRAVQGLRDFLPPTANKPIVVFTGKAEFKTEVPHGVFDISGLIDHLRDRCDELMSLNRMHFCVGRIEAARLAISGKTDVEHTRSHERRHGGPT